MRIIFSNYDDIKNPHYGGGGARSIHEIAKRFAKEFAVRVYTGKYPGCKDEFIDNVYYKRIGTNFSEPRINQLIFTFALWFNVVRNDYDVWFESFTPPFSVSFLQLFSKKPVIGLVHMLSGKDMKRKYKLPFDLIENIGLRVYKRIVVVNQSFKYVIKNINCKADVKVIKNGVSMPRLGKVKSGNYLLYLGRIEINQKGLDLLLEAYKDFSNKIEFPLKIAGGGSYSEVRKLKALIKSHELKNYVKVLGKVDDKTKINLFKKSLFVVIPSRFETFSLVALEALSCKKPVVGFNIQGLSWLPRESSVKIRKFDVDKLTQAFERLSKNRKKVNDMGKFGRTYSEKYSWDAVYEKYKKYLESLPLETGYSYGYL